jgi:SAM-dependent methyltransferase
MNPSFQLYQERFRKGEWRGDIFRDVILSDMHRFNAPSVLDIGCGRGFDDNHDVQVALAQASALALGQYIGVEPDPSVILSDIFAQTHRCLFEDAVLEPNSVDVAFCVMVLEHLERPHIFWDKVHTILRPNGVFWGFSMDARFYFPTISLLFEKLRLKDLYLSLLHGKRGTDRYENYPVFYRSNSPRQLMELGKQFSSLTYLNFSRVGQMDFYYPTSFQWIGRGLDKTLLTMNLPGSTFAVRAVK